MVKGVRGFGGLRGLRVGGKVGKAVKGWCPLPVHGIRTGPSGVGSSYQNDSFSMAREVKVFGFWGDYGRKADT